MRDAMVAVPRDLRMLVLFDEIYRTQSMTRAAERLELSQPTASIWLAKLRREWRDPLFVRTSSGMQPTPRADGLIGPAREALALLRRLSGAEPTFEPAAANRSFRICMTDASHITLLPSILKHIRAVAADVPLEIAPISANTAHLLETGEADLALGFVPGLGAGFHEQRLYKQDFVCLVNARHPRIKGTFTPRAYKDEAHIGILSSTSYPMLQEAMKSQGIQRRVQLELPGFLGLAAIVSSTDLIATVPRTIGEKLAQTASIVIHPCPVKVPTFMVSQYWHARYHHDPGVRWLRGLCVKLFSRVEHPRAKAPPQDAAELPSGEAHVATRASPPRTAPR